jgi:hypothetical protein
MEITICNNRRLVIVPFCVRYVQLAAVSVRYVQLAAVSVRYVQLAAVPGQ